MSSTRATTRMRLTASHDTFLRTRPPGADEDVHMVPAIVDHIIERFSSPGDLVLDPFAGYGTTLDRALQLGRRAAGIELLPDRVAHIRRLVPDAQIIEGDARELLPTWRGDIDLVLSSPPYMTITHHDADPLTAYENDGGDYRRYLRELGEVARHCALLLSPGGHLVWNVADIFHEGDHTPLIDDCASLLDAHLEQVGIVEIEWDRLPHDLTRDALLVFRRPPLESD
ncbi:TRM11 family methyltransferase [Corynebacterium sp.]|uniref:TRM11 family SAM-dependent methyltransferase n=1 Tax=Corynebacterium sp. TaxID=1720 RepID=UPI0026E00CD7|nr:DNA methyltransferase [Corynebacterium sp.]MDO5513134.1 DNA methyltransferase [Corynebacterium sp.]